MMPKRHRTSTITEKIASSSVYVTGLLCCDLGQRSDYVPIVPFALRATFGDRYSRIPTVAADLTLAVTGAALIVEFGHFFLPSSSIL